MIRDFSKGKKEELYRALDVIDDKEWKPFKVWCGGRVGEFGEWADRLGISSYTRQIENYQNRVLDTNRSTREQIDINFEGAIETDRRYGETFREHAETVREQIKRVQTMIQVMQSANRTGTDINMTFYGKDLQSGVSYEERLAYGQRVLLSYLKVRGISDPEEQQKICDLIMENQPSMLINLYIKDYYSDLDVGTIYNSIMDYYNKHKNDRELAYAEGLLDSYLESNGYTNSVEREFIISMIKEEHPQMLFSLYVTDRYSTVDSREIVGHIIDYYKKKQESISLEEIIEI